MFNNQRDVIEAEVIDPDVKRILVKFSGGMKPPQQALVGPGTTAQDLLQHLGLSATDYNLSSGTGDTTFGMNEGIYPNVKDGDLLFVTSRVDAGI
jgi:hypothetical protein